MITTERAEKALEFLRDSAAKYGTLRGHQAFCEANLRRIKSLEMLTGGVDGESLGKQEARAYASESYMKAIMDLQNATADMETIRATREAADMTIRVYLTQASAAKQGLSL